MISFPQVISVGAVILHEVVQSTWLLTYVMDQPTKCLETILFLLWSETKNNFRKNKASLRRITSILSNHFWRLVNKIRRNLICIVLLHMKLQLRRIKTVEMRAKYDKIRCFLPISPQKMFYQKTREFKLFFRYPQTIFCAGSR